MNTLLRLFMGGILSLAVTQSPAFAADDLARQCANWIRNNVPGLVLAPDDHALMPAQLPAQNPVPVDIALYGLPSNDKSYLPAFEIASQFTVLYSSAGEMGLRDRVIQKWGSSRRSRILSLYRERDEMRQYFRSQRMNLERLDVYLLSHPLPAPHQHYADWISLGGSSWAQHFPSQAYDTTLIQGPVNSLPSIDRDRILDQTFESVMKDGVIVYLIPLDSLPGSVDAARLQEPVYQQGAALLIREFIEAKLRDLKAYTDKKYYDLAIEVGHVKASLPSYDGPEQLAEALARESEATGISAAALHESYLQLSQRPAQVLRVTLSRRIPSFAEYWIYGRN